MKTHTILPAMTMLVFCLAAGNARAEGTNDTDKTVADKHSHTAHSHGSDAHDATGTSKAAPADADADMDMYSGTGEIIDITCHLRHDSRGPEHTKCAVYCANLGMPLGFVEDGTERIYLIIPSGHGDPKEAVLTHMAKHVKVRGVTYVAGGLRSLEVTEVDELD
ncbi:MAG TPA: hypothetical protein EYO90_03485 [Candidatus Latescibacteria bacterium]|nr:hypothetical protein [Candidatus Latescibacterota bacterium]